MKTYVVLLDSGNTIQIKANSFIITGVGSYSFWADYDETVLVAAVTRASAVGEIETIQV